MISYDRNKGAFNHKEELLLLDRIEEWVGRCNLRKVGKEGVEVAAESGEKTLQNILAQAAIDNGINSEGGDDDEHSLNSFNNTWTNNIGEGRLDEDNLSLYLRFSEGIERNEWMSNGFSDLSKYGNHATLVNPNAFDVEETTSNVDEGESDKIKKLYDLVFEDNTENSETKALLVKIKRGSSLDTGCVSCDLYQFFSQLWLTYFFQCHHKKAFTILL